MNNSSSHIGWLFSEEELNRLREESNRSSSQSKHVLSAEVTPLSVIDERRVLRMSCEQVFEACDLLKKRFPRLKVPQEIKATAVGLLRRFFTRHSVMDHDARVLTFTCVFVACKAEEFYVFAANNERERAITKFLKCPLFHEDVTTETFLAKHMKFEPQGAVQEAELMLLKGTDFNLQIHHPYRALKGYVANVRKTCPDLIPEKLLRKVIDSANEVVDKCLLSDVVFLHPPSRIALGALRMTCKEQGLSLDRYIQEQLPQTLPMAKQEELVALLDNIEPVLQQAVAAAEPTDEIFKRATKIWTKLRKSKEKKEGKEKKKKKKPSTPPPMEAAATPASNEEKPLKKPRVE